MIALISMPWALSYMPSIQLGALQANLNQHGIRARSFHWFLNVAEFLGHNAYAELCAPFLSDGEALYSYLLFPEMRGRILSSKHLRAKFEALHNKGTLACGDPISLNTTFFAKFQKLHEEIFDQVDWASYRIVGLTLNFGQNLSSLYAAREIKKRNPNIKVIFGGSEASGELGASLLSEFDYIDYCCNGEGEAPLVALYQQIEADELNVAQIDGLIYRAADRGVTVNSPSQMRRLSLPTPDFNDYFTTIQQHGKHDHEVSVCLPIEGSRGCYFNCSFCALNLQWQNYRFQKANDVTRTLSDLAKRHNISSFFFVDNIVPKNARQIFESVYNSNLDIGFFYEIRTDIEHEALAQMKQAGLSRVQIGLEALSTGILDVFNKRARFIDNLQGMKICEELEIPTCGNIIVNHPLVTQPLIEESIRNIEYCTAYRPPNAFADFDLEFGAPDYQRLQALGIEVKGNHEEYKNLYPKPLFDRLNLLRKSFFVEHEIVWDPLIEEVKRWQKSYEATVSTYGDRQRLLAMHDLGTVLRIEDRRTGALKIYLLEGVYRRLYLAAERIVSMEDLRQAVGDDLCVNGLADALKKFQEIRILYVESDSVLALAMRPSSTSAIRAYRQGARKESAGAQPELVAC